MTPPSVSILAYIFLAVVILTAEVVLYLPNHGVRRWIIGEDGVVEWLTVAGFLLAFILALVRTRAYFLLGKTAPVIFYFFLGMICLFVIAEELSWGQRIFEFQSDSFFLRHNLQKETNLHNLSLGGYKVNIVIFSILLENMVAMYFFILPLVVTKNQRLKNWVQTFACPVPRPEHSACFGIVYVLMATNQHGKAWELMELTYSLLMCLLIYQTRPSSSDV
jgi:hypothetical protein